MEDSATRFELRGARVGALEKQIAGVSLGLALGLGLGRLAFAAEMPASFEAPLAVIGVLCLIASGLFLALGILRPGRAIGLEIDPQELRGPSRSGQRLRHLPLGEIGSAQLAGWGPFRRLVIAPLMGPPLVIPTHSFAAEDGPEAFLAELRRRVEWRPDGQELLRRWDRGEGWATASRGRIPWATGVLCTLALGGFAAQLHLGALGDPERMVAMGGNWSVRVLQGELYRLVTANFLHGGWLHLASNLLLLLGAGSILERMLGTPRFTLVAGLSGLAGALTSALSLRFAYSVGISTICLGLIGCWGALNLCCRNALPPTARVSVRLALLAVAQFSLYEFVAMRSDLSAHLGGMLAGVITTLLATRGVEPQRLPVETQPWVRRGALVVGAVFFVGLARGILHAAHQLAAL
ncbi:MAG: rhomboid family intramembrane serine protease [Myxococcota bacterium]